MHQSIPKFSLILGGARSGKSGFAEALLGKTQAQKVYIATAQSFDEEMESRIARHRRDRGTGWLTIEEPLDLKAALERVPEGAVVLIDCLTLWLSNQMMAGNDTGKAISDLIDLIDQAKMPVVAVSNEVGMGLVPDTALGREFRDAQGTLNRKLAEQADLAVFMVAGLPMLLKGRLPEGMQ